MQTYEKPPLGVSPHWFVYPKRIIEISEAITRTTEFAYKYTATRNSKESYKVIRQWAIEIAGLAEIMVDVEGLKDG